MCEVIWGEMALPAPRGGGRGARGVPDVIMDRAQLPILLGAEAEGKYKLGN